MSTFLRFRSFFLLIFLLLLDTVLLSQEKQIILGGKESWQIQSQRNLVLTEGLRGYKALSLATFKPLPLEEADLYLTFGSTNTINLYGNYKQVSPTNPVFISTEYARRGSASAFFIGSRTPLVLEAENGSFFTPGSQQEQFTISFWLYSNQNHNSEVILSWKGLIENNKVWKSQSLTASFSEGSLKWIIENLFFGSKLKSKTIEIKGITPLKPKSWSHHILRYDSRKGLLEYFVNDIPEGIVRVYEGDDPSQTPLSILIGSVNDRQLILGENFTGAMEDVFISRSWIHLPLSSLYTREEGEFITEVIDLGYPDSKLLQVNTLQTTPGTTHLEYQYRLNDDITFQKEDETGENRKQVAGEWQPLKVNKILSDSRNGRYLQLKVKFLPEGSRKFTPSLSRISLSYQSNVPSGAPTILNVEAGNQEIKINWLPVLSSAIKGYRIYYGREPRVYRGERETSPIDVGNTTSYSLKGLENGVLYYISIKAYGEGNPPSQSSFSEEVKARPLDSYAATLEQPEKNRVIQKGEDF